MNIRAERKETPKPAAVKPTSTIAQDDAAVLRYYADEAEGRPCPPNKPLAGLKLNKFQSARDRLARAGKLTRNAAGRWVPT